MKQSTTVLFVVAIINVEREDKQVKDVEKLIPKVIKNGNLGGKTMHVVI